MQFLSKPPTCSRLYGKEYCSLKSFVCAAPDYNSRDDKSLSVWVLPRRITALMMILCQEGQPGSLSPPLAPLTQLGLSKDKFLSTVSSPLALSQILLWRYQVRCQWVVLHLFNTRRLIKVCLALSVTLLPQI